MILSFSKRYFVHVACAACLLSGVLQSAIATEVTPLSVSEQNPLSIITEGNISTRFAENDDYSDLQVFGDAVGDKRFVLLDEATHGDGNVFALKARLVKYLHEKKGFDVFLLESALFDASRIWMNSKASIASQAPGNLFYMYANSAEVQPLFNYISKHRTSENPLYLAGFDNRHTGGLSNHQLLSSLKTFLGSVPNSIMSSPNWASFEAAANGLIASKAGTISKSDQQHFFEIASQIAATMTEKAEHQANQAYNSASFWHRIIKSLIRMGDVAWKGHSIAYHDLEMAQNIKWLMDTVYPGQKAIIWGQYVHLSPNGNPDHTDGPPDHNVGTEVSRMWPGDVYSVHFGGGSGSYTDFITLAERAIPDSPQNSLEVLLKQQGIKTAFMDTHSLRLNPSDASTITVWSDHYKNRVNLTEWQRHWDGMFYLHTITPVVYIRR